MRRCLGSRLVIFQAIIIEATHLHVEQPVLDLGAHRLTRGIVSLSVCTEAGALLCSAILLTVCGFSPPLNEKGRGRGNTGSSLTDVYDDQLG